MRRALNVRRQIGEERFIDIKHSDLVVDPLKEVHRIYDFLGRELSSETAQSVLAYADTHASVPGAHIYSSERFALDEEQIDADFSEYLDRFDLEEVRMNAPRTYLAVSDEAYVLAERYFSEEFFRLENERLWPFVWQPACRIEEIPRPGDFVEYRIAGHSLLVVRQADDTVKVFENACRHRGTALGTGFGSFQGGQIVCPFHAWRFDLDGTCSYVYAERGFRPDTVDPGRIRLIECSVALRWGIVWVNLNRQAESFESSVAAVSSVMDTIGLDGARTNWWRSIRIRSNWKIALEAFLEAYHVLQTHPELAFGAVGDEYDADTSSYTLDRTYGHGWINDAFDGPIPNMHIAEYLLLTNRALHEGVEGWLAPAQRLLMEELWNNVPAALTADEFLVRFYEEAYAMGEADGAPLPERPALGLGYVFPNLALINNLGNSMIYRFTPDAEDPEACVWDIWSVSPASSDAPATRPQHTWLTRQEELPWIYAQDASNMELQQRGIHSPGFTHSMYSLNYEPMIPNMHSQIDRYIGEAKVH